MIIGLYIENEELLKSFMSTLKEQKHQYILFESPIEVHTKKVDIAFIESDSPFKCTSSIVWITELETPWFVTRAFPFSVYDLIKSLGAGNIDLDSKFVGVHIDQTARRVFVDGEEISFSNKEYGVIAFLRSSNGDIVNRETLLEEVWGMDSSSGARSVDVTITRVRNKLGANRAGHIQTISGEGYRWRENL